jgi:uncharacterized protein YndB with AHSA1/START domain
MGEFAFSVFINRSQQDVFDFLSDPANLSKWNSSFESAKWASSAAPGPGSTYRVSAKLLGAKKEGLFEIIQWDRPNCYSYQMNQRAFPIEQMLSAVTLQPKSNGTQVTFESHYELAGILKYAEGFFAGMGKKQDSRNFETAKKILEAGE